MLNQEIKRKIRDQLENYILKQKRIRRGMEEDLQVFVYFDLLSMDDYNYLMKLLD